MWSNSYGKNYLLFMLGGIIGSTWLGFVCKWFVTRNTFLQFLGQNTITILAVHEPIKRIVLKIAEMGTQRVGMNVTITELQENTLCSLVVVAVVFAISLITIPHIYPRMYHIKPFKNRKNHDDKKLAGSTNFRANHKTETKQHTKTIQKELLFLL